MLNGPSLVELTNLCSIQDSLIEQLDDRLNIYEKFFGSIKAQLLNFCNEQGEVLGSILSTVAEQQSFHSSAVDVNVGKVVEEIRDILEKKFCAIQLLFERRHAGEKNDEEYWQEESGKTIAESNQRLREIDKLFNSETDLLRERFDQISRQLAKSEAQVDALDKERTVVLQEADVCRRFYESNEIQLTNELRKCREELANLTAENYKLNCSLNSVNSEFERRCRLCDTQLETFKENLSMAIGEKEKLQNQLSTVHTRAHQMNLQLNEALLKSKQLEKEKAHLENEISVAVVNLKTQLQQAKILFEQEKNFEISQLRRTLIAQQSLIARIRDEYKLLARRYNKLRRKEHFTK
ncbi:Serine/threonine-protein kinase MRCK gamma [Trichinella pseudospiralis]